MLLQGTLLPSGLVPTLAGHPLCSGKASGGAGQELEAAGSREEQGIVL